MRDSRDRAIDVGNWCDVLHGQVVIPDGTAKEEED